MSDANIPPAPVTDSDHANEGKSLREGAPRGSHGDWKPAEDRPDPISLLLAQDQGRLQHLLPIKYGRMLESPFAFLRGLAAVMAADLANTPASGLQVILCGDAHLSNFGVFATPEPRLVFDINNFDETYPGPWEWDLKRLAASALVAGRENGFSEKNHQLAVTIADVYRYAMGKFSTHAGCLVLPRKRRFGRRDIREINQAGGKKRRENGKKSSRQNLPADAGEAHVDRGWAAAHP
jgi:uncharacterized protein (DUF2252 family)